MENRYRDKLSRSDHSTEAGDLNRKTSQRQGQQNDSSAEFGQSIGRSENPRGDVPSGRNSGSEGYDSSSSRSSSSGSMESSRSGSMGGSRSRNSSDLDLESDSVSRSERSRDDEGRH